MAASFLFILLQQLRQLGDFTPMLNEKAPGGVLGDLARGLCSTWVCAEPSWPQFALEKLASS
jgi:hypothetical protein